jgi:hypothetical protein
MTLTITGSGAVSLVSGRVVTGSIQIRSCPNLRPLRYSPDAYMGRVAIVNIIQGVCLLMDKYAIELIVIMTSERYR